MRIGLVTFQRASSYGAYLQMIALQTFLASEGHDVAVLDYRGLALNATLRVPILDRWYGHRASVVRRRTRLLLEQIPVVGRVLMRNRELAIEHAHRSLFGACACAFRPKYTKPFQELQTGAADAVAECEALVCGSDQIWNEGMIFSGGVNAVDFFTLAFGSSSIRRVAYAPSFGRAEISDAYRTLLAKRLSGFDALSCRERSGVEIVKSMGLRCAWVCDPTLLQSDDFFIRMAAERQGDHTIFAFELGNNPPLFANLLSCIGMQIQDVRITSPRLPDSMPDLAGWLAAIRDAKVVLTDSFHATVLAIICRRPFWSVGHFEHDRNERLLSLLDRLGLQDRLVSADSPLLKDRNGLQKMPIDWPNVEKRWMAWRDESVAFLRYALDGLRDRSSF